VKQALSRTSSAARSFHSMAQDAEGFITQAGSDGLAIGNQDEALASEDNIFDELKTTRSTSWQFELRQMEKQNRLLAEELQGLLSRKKKRKRRKGMGQMEKDCANCHTRVTPEWRRGPSGNRDLCNSCGLRWAKQNGRVSPRKYSDQSDKQSASPLHASEANADSKAAVQQSTAGLASIQPKMEGPTSPRRYGSMPSKIEEVQEPPHETVLPT